MSVTMERPAPLPMTGPRAHETMSLQAIGGIEITGIDLSAGLSEDRRDWLLNIFKTHPVLVFRDQHLTKEQQYAFTLNFGEIEGAHVNRLIDAQNYTPVHTVSNLDADGNPSETVRERGNYFWHTDKSYHAVPSLLTMLHAVELPPVGGETQFANMAMGYASLPPETKARIAGLRAVHSWEASRINCGGRPATEEQMRERPPVVHPVVRIHPDTGTKTFYGGNHSSHIEGMDKIEGQALLASLRDHATQAAFVYSHSWRQGDLVLWDNRCLLHRALPHEGMGLNRRVLHRTVVTGTVPH